MTNISSVSSKKILDDTRNNWVTMMFKTKCNYNCFRRQLHIDTCTQAFLYFERFDLNSVSLVSLEFIFISKPMFQNVIRFRIEMHPGFRKRYPRGSFWSGYEHHESTGIIDLGKSIVYCQSQRQQHGVTVVNDCQQRLPDFA